MANKVCIVESDKIVDGTDLMKGNTDLVKWDSDLSCLTNGYMMFVGCENLTSFSSDLSSLTNGMWMFLGCTKLTSFDSDLSSLTNGDQMFNGCKLDAESLKKIVISIPKMNIPNTSIYIGLGEIDYSDNGNGTATPKDIKICYDLALINHKGWIQR